MAKKQKIETTENVTEETVATATATATDEKALPKRLQIKQLIEAGGATKDTLKAACALSPASLATNFTYLRLMGFYPVTGENGVLSLTTEAGWNEIQAAKTPASAKSRTPAKSALERFLAAKLRVVRTTYLATNAEKRAAEDTSEIQALRTQRAQIDAKIAELDLADITAANPGIEEEAAAYEAQVLADEAAAAAAAGVEAEESDSDDEYADTDADELV